MTYAEMLRQLGEKYGFMDPFGCEECGGRAQSDGGIPPRPEPPIDHAADCFVGKLMAGLEELDVLVAEHAPPAPTIAQFLAERSRR